MLAYGESTTRVDTDTVYELEILYRYEDNGKCDVAQVEKFKNAADAIIWYNDDYAGPKHGYNLVEVQRVTFTQRKIID